MHLPVGLTILLGNILVEEMIHLLGFIIYESNCFLCGHSYQWERCVNEGIVTCGGDQKMHLPVGLTNLLGNIRVEEIIHLLGFIIYGSDCSL